MKIVIDEFSIFIFVVAIFLIYFIIKKMAKTIRTILIIIVGIALIMYVVGLSNMIKPLDEHTRYSINYIAEQAKLNMKTHRDSVRYYDIILPIYDDITSRYSNVDLLKLERQPAKYIQIINESIERNKQKILTNLAKENEKQLFDNFIDDWNYKLTKQE